MLGRYEISSPRCDHTLDHACSLLHQYASHDISPLLREKPVKLLCVGRGHEDVAHGERKLILLFKVSRPEYVPQAFIARLPKLPQEPPAKAMHKEVVERELQSFTLKGIAEAFE